VPLTGFGRRDEHAVEEMDRPDCDPMMLQRTYAQFAMVNPLVAGWRRTYVRLIRPALSAAATNTLLDIGSGGGDVPRALARWARRDGLELQVTAADPDPRAHAFAAARPAPGVAYRRAYSSELAAEGRRYDVVTSNHLLHHLGADELAGLLGDCSRLAARLAVHSDIERSRTAYALFGTGSVVFRGSFIRRDGLTSIRRSYRARELGETTLCTAGRGWTVQRQFPSRLLLVLRKR
jgi:2-polyprenyl-3-methyl-5-hydroxy-6-metoxy-1,4-benzoquinol methylase